MTKAEDKEPDYETAKAVVDKEDAARKDGLTVERTDTASGIVLKPDPNDRSVATYDPQNLDQHKPEAPAKPSKRSGEPVHDRS